MSRRKVYDFKKNTGTSAYWCASTFYGLEALKVAVTTSKEFEGFRKSHERLAEDIKVYQDTVATKLSQMLYDYSALAVFGELRHCIGCAKVRYTGCGLTPKTEQKRSRNQMYEEALNFSPESILNLGVKLFDPSNGWDSAFGGAKWQTISKTALRFGKIDKLMYCDTVFSLSHNCSFFLNKNETRIFFITDRDAYKNLLDAKFEKTPVEVINYIILHSGNIDREFLKLIQRANALGFLSLMKGGQSMKAYLKCLVKINLLEEIDKNYQPLKYRNRTMNPKKRYNFCNSIQEEKFYESLEVGTRVIVKEGNNKYNYKANSSTAMKARKMGGFNVYGDNTIYATINELRKLGFQNSYSTLVVKSKLGSFVTVQVGADEEMMVDFKQLVYLNENLKPVMYKERKQKQVA